ncbi:MAG: hypothetical protein GF308_14010 [Candidatus Heimdallarchaeota archaeon]|nr:hypothetical protein [Candidatus Heimdallarchaeota archaeon]
MKKKYLWVVGGIIGVIIIGLGGWGGYLLVKRNNQNDNNPLYLTIIVHTEEDEDENHQPKYWVPDYNGNETVLLHFTSVMREFATIAADHGAKINFGTDWTFAEGVANYDPTFFTDIEALGHEVDTHAHESHILYNSVRQRIVQAGGTPTKVASGMLEAAIYHKIDYFDNQPYFRILWGVSLPGHTAGEAIPGWVWRPSRTDWTVHEPTGDYIYIGPGDQVNNATYIQQAIECRHEKRINTYAVFASPRGFKAAINTPGMPENWTAKLNSFDYWENRLAFWDEFLTELDKLSGLEYASLTEIVEIFEQEEENLSFNWEAIPRSDASLTQRNKDAGYPIA